MNNLTAKSNNKSFSFICEMPNKLNGKMTLKAFNTPFTARELQGKKVITLEDYSIKNAGSAKELCTFFGRPALPKGTINIEVSVSDFEYLQSLKKEAENILQELKQENNRLAELCPKTYILAHGYYMGDYASEDWSEIKVERTKTDLENFEGTITHRKYSLRDVEKISENLSNEWYGFIKSNKPEYDNLKIEVSQDFAEKWIAISLQISELAEAEKAAKEEKKQAKVAKENADRQAKFDKAKATGEKVLLYSTFLTGNDIPRYLRDKDSDMGHLLSYAMPDGSVKEEFSHAY